MNTVCLSCIAHLVTSTKRICTVLVTTEEVALSVIKRVLISETHKLDPFWVSHLLCSRDYFLFSLIASCTVLLYFRIIFLKRKKKKKASSTRSLRLTWFCLPINHPLVEELGSAVFYHCGRVQFHSTKTHHFTATVLMTHQGKACVI